MYPTLQPRVHRPVILLVDDDRDTLEALVACLEFYLPDVLLMTSLSGVEAVGLTTTSEVDVLITDWNMPVMNGLKLVEEVRNCYPLTRIIVMTGHADDEQRRQALNAGAFAFVPKPINRDMFIAFVQRALFSRFHDQHPLNPSPSNPREGVRDV